MGHCDTSAQLGGDGGVYAAGERAAEAAAAGGAGQAERHGSELNDSSLNGRARSAGAWAVLALVRFYIVFLSPFFGGACKFYPSCSNYAREAIVKHGARRGMALAAKRLLRCRPFTQGGFDPVPEPDGYDEKTRAARVESFDEGAGFHAELKLEPPKGQKL